MGNSAGLVRFRNDFFQLKNPGLSEQPGSFIATIYLIHDNLLNDFVF
jgi:hypothetical protein